MASSDGQERDSLRLAKLFMESSFRIMQTVRTRIRRFEPDELSVPQFRLMMTLMHEHDPSVADIAEIMELSRPAISRLVDGLVAKEYVSRVDAPEDRRRVTLRLTDTGREIVDAVDRQLLSAVAEIFNQLPDTEWQTVNAALEVLYNTIAPGADSPPLPPPPRSAP